MGAYCCLVLIAPPLCAAVFGLCVRTDDRAGCRDCSAVSGADYQSHHTWDQARGTRHEAHHSTTLKQAHQSITLAQLITRSTHPCMQEETMTHNSYSVTPPPLPSSRRGRTGRQTYLKECTQASSSLPVPTHAYKKTFLGPEP